MEIKLTITEPSVLGTPKRPESLFLLWKALCSAVQSLWCVLNGGHHKLLHTEPDRIALRCVACGYTSPGWIIETPRILRKPLLSQPRR